MADYDALLQPFTLKGVTFRNRVMSTSHAPGYGEDGKPQERYQRYHEEKAKGGIALTNFGGATSVGFDSPASEFNQLSVADDSVIPHLQAFADRVHRHGAKTMIQLNHAGRKVMWETDPWLAPIGPSRVREPLHRGYPKAAEVWDIKRLVKAFADGARRCKAGGLDGLEIQGAFHSVIDVFWSPIANQRTDAYGGSLENRMRFSIEVLEAIRDAVDEDFLVGIRMSADELLEGGLGPDDCLAIAKRLAASGLVDFLDVVVGTVYDQRAVGLSMAGMDLPLAPYLDFAGWLRSETGLAVFHGGRITDLATAARAVDGGYVDMVSMTRPHLADPHLVRKLMENRLDDVRECVGANYCIHGTYRWGVAYCLHNAATGREQTMPHIIPKAAQRRRVVVVGAGPGGLEAARVSAERGHEVVLFEAAERVGGQVNLAAKTPKRESMSGITRWLEHRVRSLGVDLRLETTANGETVAAEAPDLVVIATGGTPDVGDFEGAELALSTWDIISGKVQPGDNVLLFDDDGREAGAGCAQLIADRGAQLELVTSDRHTLQDANIPSTPGLLRALYDSDTIMTPDLQLIRVVREGNKLVAVLRNVFNDAEEEREIDQVVAEHGTAPRDRIYFDLVAHSINLGEVDLPAMAEGTEQNLRNNPDGSYWLFRVGDAVSSRNVHAAIYDSLRLCKSF